jgi:hypothetical protein
VKTRRSLQRRHSRAGRSRTNLDCLDVLIGDEASAVLRQLLLSYPELIPAARQAANALLATVTFTDIATSVFEGLIALDLDDLDAGPRAAGYVEPSEAAWAAIENVTAPYFRDLERRVTLRHEDEATAVCKGIVVGLYRAEQRGFELLEYAEDGPSELAGLAVATWQRRRRNVSLPRTFVETFTPDWDWLAG